MDGSQVESTESAAIAPSAASEVARANTTPKQQAQNSEQVAVQQPKVEVKAPQPKKEGWEKVDFQNDAPEKIEQRFNRLYKQVKDSQRGLSDRDEILAQQAEVIKQLSEKQNQVISHLHEKDFASAEASLRQAKKDARARGDEDALDEIDEKLLEIKAKKLIASQQPRQQAQAQQQRPQNAAEAGRYAASQGAIPTEEQETIQVWQEEADEYGEPLRPWAQASDPQYAAALIEARAVFTNPKFARKSMEERLAEVDRRMGLERAQPQQQVMSSTQRGGNLTRANGNRNMGSVQLTDRAANMAVRTKFAGPGKSNDEHLEAYRKQVLKVRGGQ